MATPRRALFLDRDGTIIEHVPYLKEPEKVALVRGMAQKIIEFRNAGYLAIIITNQSGIGRGIISKKQYDAVNARMEELLEEQGAKIDAIFMCPSKPEDKDPRRKPSPAMILEAAKKYKLSLVDSVMVGDSASDMGAGISAGVGRNIFSKNFVFGDFSP
jgi:D-glycero-D-manno-heptose 1,7-bisphosphate phosphatase